MAFPPLSAEQQSILMQPISREEVRNALFAMAPLKAPDPDGLHAMFYYRS